MPRQTDESDYAIIVELVRELPEGATLGQIMQALPAACPRRTLQDRIKRLVDQGRLIRSGAGRWTRYRVAGDVAEEPVVERGASASRRRYRTARLERPHSARVFVIDEEVTRW